MCPLAAPLGWGFGASLVGERGGCEEWGSFVAPWLFDFSVFAILRAGGPVYLRLPSEKSHILCYYKSSVVLAPTYVGRYLNRYDR